MLVTISLSPPRTIKMKAAHAPGLSISRAIACEDRGAALDGSSRR
jgi:hypothetical protein